MSDSPFMQAAKSRAARMGQPDSYVFSPAQPPVTKLADNGFDVIIDVEATDAKYAGVAEIDDGDEDTRL